MIPACPDGTAPQAAVPAASFVAAIEPLGPTRLDREPPPRLGATRSELESASETGADARKS